MGNPAPMAVDIQRIGAIRIFVRDLPRARDFYAGLLNLPERVDGEAFSAFRLAGIDIVIEVATDDQAGMVGRFAGFSFAVPDIEAAVSDLSAAGVPVLGAPEKQFWGGILAHIADPDGNELTLVQYPAGPSA
jgi:predicted enzyme related to lactoylglutathione lyase